MDEIKSDISAFRWDKAVVVVVVDISALSVATWLRAGGLAG